MMIIYVLLMWPVQRINSLNMVRGTYTKRMAEIIIIMLNHLEIISITTKHIFKLTNSNLLVSFSLDIFFGATNQINNSRPTGRLLFFLLCRENDETPETVKVSWVFMYGG